MNMSDLQILRDDAISFLKKSKVANINEELIVQKIAELEYLEEISQYQRERASAYPDWGTQLDYIYHNGVDAWKADIVDPVKEAYPKVEIDETELANRRAQSLFDYQLEEYTKAVARLAQYQLSLGREELTELQDGPNQLTDSDGMHVFDSDGSPVYEQIEVVVQTAIEPLPATVTQTEFDSDGNSTQVEVPNPRIVKDDEERASAQDVINNTEQAVIDHYQENN